jgi:hypothetical protein
MKPYAHAPGSGDARAVHVIAPIDNNESPSCPLPSTTSTTWCWAS